MSRLEASLNVRKRYRITVPLASDGRRSREPRTNWLRLQPMFN
jgi:hypothetical protein